MRLGVGSSDVTEAEAHLEAFVAHRAINWTLRAFKRPYRQSFSGGRIGNGRIAMFVTGKPLTKINCGQELQPLVI